MSRRVPICVVAVGALLALGCERSHPAMPTATPVPTPSAGAVGVTTATATPEPAVELPPIRYRVSFPEPHTHYAEVEADFPTDGAPAIELMMAVWTPGSYLVREYARNIETVSAWSADGQSLPVEKVRKNRWRVRTDGRAHARVRYRLYCREMSVRSNWVEADMAIINGAATFLTLADDEGPRPHDVQFVLPPGWRESVTSLPRDSSGVPDHYVAPSFDILVDSPVVLGNPIIRKFVVENVPHYLVDLGGDDVFDHDKAAADLEKLVREEVAFWRVVPYDRYYFLNVLSESGGGLEHLNSTMIMSSRWATRTRASHLDWVRLASHEFFHTWNVKRMRPHALGPFDYENEVYTRSLWVAEGVTSYYDNLLLHRAGLTTQDEYLKRASERIRGTMTKPGRRVQPLEDASFDAWIKYYRGDENSDNATISYYSKGSVVAFLLDAKIRKLTDGARSLDDVMRLTYERYSGARGYTPEDFRSVVSEVAGQDLGPWLHRVLETTEPLDFSEAVAWYGLELFDAGAPPPHQPGEPAPDPVAGYLGIQTTDQNGRLLVTRVRRGEPAYEAGINVDDEILAIGGYRVTATQLADRLQRFPAGQEVGVMIARREKILTIPVLLGERPANAWDLRVSPEATEAQRSHLNAWLTGRTPGS